MKAYKVELLIVDSDNIGETEIINILENTRYSNWCISPTVEGIVSKDIGEWHDNHPLNSSLTRQDEYRRLFDN